MKKMLRGWLRLFHFLPCQHVARPIRVQPSQKANEDALKAIAYELRANPLDDSAPRATMHEIRMNNQLQLIGINTRLLIQQHCATSTEPTLLNVYASSALDCALALQNRSGSSGVPPECDRSKWERKQPKSGPAQWHRAVVAAYRGGGKR